MLDAVAGLASYTEHDARQIAVAVLEALCHAHGDARRCVHRDLRPEHVLVSRDATASAKAGLGQRVKVAGWGRSKRLPQGGLVPGEHCFGNRCERGRCGDFVLKAEGGGVDCLVCPAEVRGAALGDRYSFVFKVVFVLEMNLLHIPIYAGAGCCISRQWSWRRHVFHTKLSDAPCPGDARYTCVRRSAQKLERSSVESCLRMTLLCVGALAPRKIPLALSPLLVLILDFYFVPLHPPTHLSVRRTRDDLRRGAR